MCQRQPGPDTQIFHVDPWTWVYIAIITGCVLLFIVVPWLIYCCLKAKAQVAAENQENEEEETQCNRNNPLCCIFFL